MGLWAAVASQVDYSSTEEHKKDASQGLDYRRRSPIVKIREVLEDSHEQQQRQSALSYRASPGSSVGSDEEQWSAEEDDVLDQQEDREIRARYQYRRSSSLHFDDALVFHPTNQPRSTSPLPSLSPSRPRLFDDDSDADDDDDELFVVLRTPSPLSSSPASLSTKANLAPKAVDRRPTSTDPLLSPPSSSPTLAHAFGRRTSVGWLPTPPRDQDRRLSTSSNELPSPAPLVPHINPAQQPTISLLTKSLRSLARLPNLALEQPAPPQSPLCALDLEGLGAVDENPWEWRGGRGERSAMDEAWEVPPKRVEGSSSRSAGPISSVPLLRRLPPALVDNEHATVVQLQTFSSPSPPSPPRKTIDLPPVPAVVAVEEEEDPTPLSPPITRYISNPRHLLMISLELSMMRADKIRSPLRPRAVVVRCGGSAQVMGSGLRFEVQA